MKYIEHPPNRPICFSPAVAAKPEQPEFREPVFYGIGWTGAALALQPVARGGPLQFRVGLRCMEGIVRSKSLQNPPRRRRIAFS